LDKTVSYPTAEGLSSAEPTRQRLKKPHVLLLAVVLAATPPTRPVHLEVTTSVSQAQAAFDRGLFLYYAYDGDDAQRSFAQAAAFDPQLAMAFWGIALAQGPDLNTPVAEDRFAVAAVAIRKASASARTASPLERRFIEIMALRYQGTFADHTRDDAAYRHAMLAFAQTSRDENAELLAAEALMEHGGLEWNAEAPASDETQQALRLIEGVLSDDAQNVMANHLCIHLYDLAPNRAPARPCAERLDAEAWSAEAEHLAHMPAHYWIETGNYARALNSSERAYQLMAQLTAADATSAHVQHYAKHDVAVGYSAAMMLGNYTQAQRWSQRMSVAFGTNFDAITALRFGRYEAAYAASNDEFSALSVRGLAALHLGRIGEAETMAARLRSDKTTDGYMPALLLAELAEARGHEAEAEAWIDASRANQRANFSGELIPLIPADEALGTIRLEHGDAGSAIEAFTAALAAYPNDPRALYGLARALSASGRRAQATASDDSFAQTWKGADTNAADALP